VKPMLAEDWIEAKVQFPVIMQPKIDGVRGLNLTGKLTGRSLKSFGNRHVTSFFSRSAFIGLDGELAAAHECDPALCRLTTSALGKHEGEPFVLWWLFDYVTVDTVRWPYFQRRQALANRLRDLQGMAHLHPMAGRLRLVPQKLVTSLDRLNELDAQWLDMGYEGSILRHPHQPVKFGRSTVNEGGLLRIKRFIEEDAVVNSITEGQSNGNEATINALGQTERSTHQANMTPNGMVGSLECTDVKTGKPITVAAGTMPHDERVRYFREQHLLIGQTIKYKTFPKGVKDKPRFPTFQSIRMKEDQ
jgi:DNA ligase 1